MDTVFVMIETDTKSIEEVFASKEDALTWIAILGYTAVDTSNGCFPVLLKKDKHGEQEIHYWIREYNVKSYKVVK